MSFRAQKLLKLTTASVYPHFYLILENDKGKTSLKNSGLAQLFTFFFFYSWTGLAKSFNFQPPRLIWEAKYLLLFPDWFVKEYKLLSSQTGLGS